MSTGVIFRAVKQHMLFILHRVGIVILSTKTTVVFSSQEVGAKSPLRVGKLLGPQICRPCPFPMRAAGWPKMTAHASRGMQRQRRPHPGVVAPPEAAPWCGGFPQGLGIALYIPC